MRGAANADVVEDHKGMTTPIHKETNETIHKEAAHRQQAIQLNGMKHGNRRNSSKDGGMKCKGTPLWIDKLHARPMK
jgi:hypothetical protein